MILKYETASEFTLGYMLNNNKKGENNYAIKTTPQISVKYGQI